MGVFYIETDFNIRDRLRDTHFKREWFAIEMEELQVELQVELNIFDSDAIVLTTLSLGDDARTRLYFECHDPVMLSVTHPNATPATSEEIDLLIASVERRAKYLSR